MPGNTTVVEEVRQASGEVADALRALLPQLSSSAGDVTDADLGAIVRSPSTFLFVARPSPGAPIMGSLTLAVFRIPTGVRAWIEDVVVDAAGRGHGVGSALVLAAIEKARVSGCRTVELTSRPSRHEANRLYTRLGFETRQTNVYRYELGTPGSEAN